MASPGSSDRLDSWKEIAAYLGRSVRTVRRWEAHEGLPIHRQMHRSRATVYAYRAEIDAWQCRGEAASPAAAAVPSQDGRRSIVVLPFGYVGPSPEADYLADGFTEEVIAHLSEVRSLRVISRTSSMALKGTTKDAGAIGRALSVRYLVEGAVRRAGDRLRITTRVVDATSDDRLWSQAYEGNLDDVFAIQERIARSVAAALEVGLTAAEDRRISGRGLDDLGVWRCVLQARREALRWREDAIDSAVERLRDALARLGGHRALYVALGRAYLQYREAGIDEGDEPLQLAEQCVAQAVALDPDDPAVLQLRGWIHYSRGRIQDAVRDLEAAARADANDPDALALLANYYLISGRQALARPVIDRLLSIDPLTPVNRCLPGWADALEGRTAAAIEPYAEMLALDPDNPMARLFYAWILASNRRGEEVRAVVAGFSPSLRGTPPARIAEAYVRALAGEQLPELGGPGAFPAGTSDVFPRLLAQAYALAGDADRALPWLRAAVDRGFVNYPYLAEHDPLLAPVRRDPRFLELLEEVRRRWEAFAAC